MTNTLFSKKNYQAEVDPNERDRATNRGAVYVARSVERLKLFAGVEDFDSNEQALEVLERFKDVFIDKQYQELKGYYG